MRRRRCAKCGIHGHYAKSCRIEIPIGQRFGELVIVGQAPSNRGLQVFTRCDCGTEKRIRLRRILKREISFCGTARHRGALAGQRAHCTRTYVIEAIGAGLIKIGCASNINDRLKHLQFTCPIELRVVAVSDENVERRLHDMLRPHRAHGEWFRQSSEVMSTVLSLCRSESISVLATLGVGSRGIVKGRQYRCKRCGEFGHFAKTCSRHADLNVAESATEHLDTRS